MRLFEFDENMDNGYYEPTEDDVNIRQLTDTRKPVLTLKHLNRLKKIRALQQLEDLKKEDLLSTMYSQPSEGGGDFGGGSMGF